MKEKEFEQLLELYEGDYKKLRENVLKDCKFFNMYDENMLDDATYSCIEHCDQYLNENEEDIDMPQECYYVDYGKDLCCFRIVFQSGREVDDIL